MHTPLRTLLGQKKGKPHSVSPNSTVAAAVELMNANKVGSVLVMEGDRLVTVPLERHWTRIGRSLAADVRLDDATVSRRHALIVRQADGVRVLDDRSLNGVFVNGSRIEWSSLGDGDELIVGRYRLHFVEVPAPDA